MKKLKPKAWHKVLFVDTIHYQKDWGDHPQTGDWTSGYTVYSHETSLRVTKRIYSRFDDARRGAAQIYNQIEKALLE